MPLYRATGALKCKLAVNFTKGEGPFFSSEWPINLSVNGNVFLLIFQIHKLIWKPPKLSLDARKT